MKVLAAILDAGSTPATSTRFQAATSTVNTDGNSRDSLELGGGVFGFDRIASRNWRQRQATTVALGVTVGNPEIRTAQNHKRQGESLRDAASGSECYSSGSGQGCLNNSTAGFSRFLATEYRQGLSNAK